MAAAEGHPGARLQGMHRQLAALRALVEAVDPGLAAFLAARDHQHYYFAFRWLLVHFKREFPFEDVRHPPSPPLSPYHLLPLHPDKLFVAVLPAAEKRHAAPPPIPAAWRGDKPSLRLHFASADGMNIC